MWCLKTVFHVKLVKSSAESLSCAGQNVIFILQSRVIFMAFRVDYHCELYVVSYSRWRKFLHTNGILDSYFNYKISLVIFVKRKASSEFEFHFRELG
jgi:hypothetical protein